MVTAISDFYTFVVKDKVKGCVPALKLPMYFYTSKRYNASHKFRTKNAIQPPKPRAVEEINSSTIDIKIEK